MKLGVHCSVRRGVVDALEEARRLGCETLQIFTRAPRLWRTYRMTDEEARLFREKRHLYQLAPLVVHTPYLPNLCTTHEKIHQRSVRALREDLEACRKLDADFLVIHPGAFSPGSNPQEGIARMGEALNEALQVDGRVRILLENMAGGGRRLGSTWEELSQMFERIKNPSRVGLCLDTAHTLGAGYPFSSAAGARETLNALDQQIGFERIFVIHLNDSAAAQGSHLDLHEHIGRGFIALDVFQSLLRHPGLQHCAAILETPKKGFSDDAQNLEAIRRLM